ncbi:protein kinase subdomain-containing protein PKL/CAK/Fmp29 [Irpex rosettiformis]|uniref:Protein kinase subdomain-containing protein PKL/CAK/Fmp29 n=1 Tax=Irpex rosettiformis TaxID=378272 RepID=A0ACB8TRD4_9APHY|nr:protein kinase subdomain-containing protein PKL/CAK/Fmp29 [Irpex rosettiformis]
MPYPGSARAIFNSLKTSAALVRSLYYSSVTPPVSITTRFVPRRAFSIMADPHENLFNYTAGRWVFNDALRLAERRLVFDVDGLCGLAAQSVGRNPADVVKISKLAEGGFNRTFLITLADDFQMVARVPYPATVPKHYAVASEAATVEFLRSSGLPVPKIYGHSPASDNAAKTEYIFMEFIRGTKLSDIWLELGETDLVPILRQLTQLESQMMSISFPAGGSLYYAHDLEKLTGKPPMILLKDDKRFCVGPDTRLPMWYGRRSQLAVDRGPYENAEAALVAGARKELAYLEQFGQPLLPFRRERRDGYQYQEQLPSAHIENLKRYLLITPSLVPRNPALNRFCIRHPDLQESNIIVRRSDSGWKVVSLLDWQHASILPLFLLAGVPQRFQNHDDPVSQSMTPPSLPENFDNLEEPEQIQAEDVYRRRLIHYHYVKSTEEYNKPHYDAMTDYMCVLRSRLCNCASNPWEGETLELKVALIRAMERWKTLTGESMHMCPLEFDDEDLRETTKLNEAQEKADETFNKWQDMLGLGPEGWVPAQFYKEALEFCKQMKQRGLMEAESEEDREEIKAHWPWDDMDEEKYM